MSKAQVFLAGIALGAVLVSIWDATRPPKYATKDQCVLVHMKGRQLALLGNVKRVCEQEFAEGVSK